MRKIAIIAPCILPVPALKGGAVEELVTTILNQNEISKDFLIDLYTIENESYDQSLYNNTSIIPVSANRFLTSCDGIMDSMYRHFLNDFSAKRFLDKTIIKNFIDRLKSDNDDYYAVIVENQMSTACELIRTLGQDRDFPVYFHMHNDVDIYRSPEEIRYLTAAGVQFLCVSKYISSQILKYAPKAVCHILYNGVDFDNYSTTTKQPTDEVKFLYAGRIIPDKGVLELATAFNKSLATNDTPISLDIVGFSGLDAGYEKQVKDQAAKNASSIHCRNKVTTQEMADLYNEYDVVVMPTISEEPFGLVALETIAKGIPLITTNSGALPEVVGDGAVIVDKDVDFINSLSAAILELSSNKEYRLKLGKNGQNLARKNVAFDINGYYHRLVEILNNRGEGSGYKETISVIVPVYNVEQYLGRCVDSLVNQTYSDLEIILVDDGSKDNSGHLCDTYAKKDARIKVVHQANQGLSGARNTGLDNATGSYIFFLDSDDYLEENAFELMLNNMHRWNADIVACGIQNVYDNSSLNNRFTSDKPGVWSGRDSVIQMMRTNNICTVAWNKLYKASLWQDIRFTVGILHEDEDVTYKPLYMAKIVSFIPDCLYDYYQRDGSLVHLKQELRYKDYLNAIEKRILYFEDNNEKELIEHSFLTLLDYLKYVYRETGKETQTKIVALYRKSIAERGLPDCCSLKKKFALWLWRYYQY